MPVPAPSESFVPFSPGKKLWWYLFLLIVLGLGLHFLLPQAAKIEHALKAALTLQIPFVALALTAQILSYLSSGYLLRCVVRLESKTLSVGEAALITLGANSVGTLGGGVPGTAGMTFLWLQNRGVSLGAAGLGGSIPIFLNNAMLAIVSVPGLLILLLLGKFSGGFAIGFVFAGLILAGGMAAFLWSLSHREKLMKIAMRIATLVAKLRRRKIDCRATEVAVERMLKTWDAFVEDGWRRPVVGAALDTGFDMATLGFLFLAAGHGVNPLVLTAGYALPQLLGKLTVILGGVGVVETSMVALYRALGVPTQIAFVVVLVYRLFSFWLPTLIGVALVPYFGREKS